MRAGASFGAGLLFAIASGQWALGQDYPAGVQVLYGTIDNDSLTVQCTPPSDGKMRCSFAQTMVSRPADHEDFEGTLSKRIDEALTSDELKSCDGIADLATALRTGSVPKVVDDPAEFTRGMAAMKPEQKAEMLKQVDLLAAFCAKPSRGAAEAVLRATRSKDLKTCKVWTNTYEQEFATSDGGKTWISNEGPKGECGVIYISKFQKAKSEFSFWTYTTQKVVTKKDGDPILNICSGLDERQIFYDWSGDERYLNCTYIKFGF